jgi:DNA-directed RNA polymerase specialized sigma24 family protein
VVVLVHAYGMSHSEAADLLGLKRSSIQNHLERGLEKLRTDLGVHDHA